MKNYYELLNISKTASYKEIKTAYRALAKKYHPDKNLHNPHTEELFKQISIAYDTLSSPAKKSRYDSILSYQEYKPVTPTQNTHYQTYTKPRAKQYKKPATTSYYDPNSWINLNTKKFIAVLCLATLFVFGIIGAANYVQYHQQEVLKQKYIAKYQLYFSFKAIAEKQFSEGKYTASMLTANEMLETLPLFGDAKEFQKNIQEKIDEAGIIHLDMNEYPQAVDAFQALLELGNRTNNIDMLNYHLGLAYYYNNQAQDAVNLLSNFETDYNPSIPTLLAIIYRDDFKDTNEALKWHRNAKQILSVLYRNVGFQFSPNDAPEGHYEAYYQSALTSYNLKDFNTALQDLRGALFLRSANRDALFMKGLCEVELGFGEACNSFEKAKKNGHILADEMLAKRCR